MVNMVVLVGRLGKDSETKFTQAGKAVTNFSVATDFKPREGEKKTEWHNIVLWDAEKLATYLVKGKQVYIKGRLQTRKWQDKEGNDRYSTEVVAEDVRLLGSKDDSASRATQQQAPAAELLDDDVPF